jgi:hypothetical protein
MADDIRSLLFCISDVQHAASRQYMKDSIVEIVKAILEANSLVDEFLKRSRIGRVYYCYVDIVHLQLSS